MKVRDVLRSLAEGGRLSRVERFALESVLTSRTTVLDCNIVEGPAPEVPARRAPVGRRMPRHSTPRADALRSREG